MRVTRDQVTMDIVLSTGIYLPIYCGTTIDHLNASRGVRGSGASASPYKIANFFNVLPLA